MKVENFKLESLFFDFCQTAKIVSLIDIGSNQPQNGEIFFDKLNHSSKYYYAFEANPITYNYYFRKFPDNFVFSNLAIGQRNGFVAINVPDTPNHASINRLKKLLKKIDELIFKNYHSNLETFHTASNLGGSEKWHLSTTNKYLVPMVRLDSLFLKFENYTALWIDVEGSTVEVLNGLGKLLNSDKLIAVFIESENLADSEDKWKKLDSYRILLDAGFSFVRFSEINNGLFVRSKFVEMLDNSNPNHSLRKPIQKRKTYSLRLKSLVYRGDKLFAEW
jgi:FkbM family methyltransferase